MLDRYNAEELVVKFEKQVLDYNSVIHAEATKHRPERSIARDDDFKQAFRLLAEAIDAHSQAKSAADELEWACDKWRGDHPQWLATQWRKAESKEEA